LTINQPPQIVTSGVIKHGWEIPKLAIEGNYVSWKITKNYCFLGGSSHVPAMFDDTRG